MKTAFIRAALALAAAFGAAETLLAGGAAAPAPLRVGILPDADSLPLMAARDEGLFEAEGVDVELVKFLNPQERDAAMQAGSGGTGGIDGAVSDLPAAAFFAAAGFDAKVTSLTDGRYGIAGAPASPVRSLAGLRGKRIGLSANTIIHYAADTLLENAGLERDGYEAVSVPRMPLRLEMVLNGRLDAAVLPEPLLTAAVEQGAVLLGLTDGPVAGIQIDAGIQTDAGGQIDAGVILFSKKALDTRLDSIKRFYRAYYKAALRINADPDAYRDYLVKEAGFPAEIRDAYRFVTYRKPALPDPAQIERVLSWLKARKLLEADIAASALLDGRAVADWRD